MDRLGVRRQKIPRGTVTRRKQREKEVNSRKEQQVEQPIKVIHFSDQVRITTTPSDFKSRVQELTGRNSNVAAMFASPDPAAEELDASVLTASSVLRQRSSSTGSSSDPIDGSQVSQILLADGGGGCAFAYEDIEVGPEWLQYLDELAELPPSKLMAVEPRDRCKTDEEL